MAELNLDTLNVDAVNAAYNLRHSLSRHEVQDRDRAVKIAVSTALNLYLTKRKVIISDPRYPQNLTITIQTTDDLQREDLIRLMASSIIHNGTRYAFDNLGANSIDDDGVTSKNWIEITFKPVDDASHSA